MRRVARPKNTGSNVVVGPYVDLYGADMYIMTFSLPIHVDGRFVGIAGADIALHRFERILLSSLIKMENEALIVSEEGRIIAANTADAGAQRLRVRVGDATGIGKDRVLVALRQRQGHGARFGRAAQKKDARHG